MFSWIVTIAVGWIALTVVNIAVLEVLIVVEGHRPGRAQAWAPVLAVLPVIGFIVYFVFGRMPSRKFFARRRWPEAKLKSISASQLASMTIHSRLVNTTLYAGFAPLAYHNKVTVLGNGRNKFGELFRVLEHAQQHIHIEYYIFKDDEIGGDLHRILSRKAREGVTVRLLVDGMGSHKLSAAFLNSLREAGVQVQQFLPLKLQFLGNKIHLRNHRKIVVVDGQVAMMGGMNVGDEYLSRDPQKGYWRDTHLLIEGEAVHSLQAAFSQDWYFVTEERLAGIDYYPEPKHAGEQTVQIVAGGPDIPWHNVQQVFFAALSEARQRIVIETPYFIPDSGTLMALENAALAGLDVKLVVQGVPEYTTTYWASRSFFEGMLRAGVKIFLYEKGILHAKTMVIDDQVGVVGTANFDVRSFGLDFEVAAIIYDREFVEKLNQDIGLDLNNCRRLKPETFYARSFGERFKEGNARFLSLVL